MNFWDIRFFFKEKFIEVTDRIEDLVRRFLGFEELPCVELKCTIDDCCRLNPLKSARQDGRVV